MTKRKKITIIAICAAAAAVAVAACIILLNGGSSVKGSVDLEEARAELDNYSFTNHDNMSFNCKAEGFSADKLYNITAKNNDPLSDKDYTQLQKLVESFSGEKVDVSKMEKLSDTNISCDGEFSGGEYYTSGTFGLWLSEVWDKTSADNTEVVENIKATENLAEKTYKVGGADYSIEQAKDYCDKYIEQNMTQFFNKNETQKLSDVILLKSNTTDDYCYVMHYQHVYEGLSVNDAGFSNLDSEYFKPSYLELIVIGKDKIGKIDNRGYYSIEGQEEVSGKVIPLSVAENRVSEYLAPNLNYKVSEVALKYCTKTKMTDNDFIYKPMWSFTLSENAVNGTGDYLPSITAYVDVFTGEVYVYDSNSSTMY